MIRVIILLVFLFIVWVLYASGFERARKVRISIAAMVFCAVAFWFDGYDKREISGLVALDSIENCGLTTEFSYRSNFDFELCVQNNAQSGTLSRLDIVFIANNCVAEECLELQRVERSVLVDIPPTSQKTLSQNISFDQVDPNLETLSWSAIIVKSKGHR